MRNDDVWDDDSDNECASEYNGIFGGGAGLGQASKKSAQADPPAVEEKAGFHHEEDCFGSGARISHHLSAHFQQLFGKLVTSLHVQTSRILRQQQQSDLEGAAAEGPTSPNRAMAAVAATAVARRLQADLVEPGATAADASGSSGSAGKD